MLKYLVKRIREYNAYNANNANTAYNAELSFFALITF